METGKRKPSAIIYLNTSYVKVQFINGYILFYTFKI